MIVDMAVHPVLGDDELRELAGSPWRDVDALPHHLGSRYAAPFPELRCSERDAGNPAEFMRSLFADGTCDAAVLAPLSRGLLPSPQQGAAVAGAFNRWLKDSWLAWPESQGRCFGSIRISVDDTAAAVRELEAWASDERFVQVVVPLRVFAPYGDARYFPIWDAAAGLGLPVYVHDDHANTIEPRWTSVGNPRYFAEAHALRPLAGIFHLASLITSGVFERLPDLRFVFGDGGLDLARSMMWRLDKDWRSGRVEVPWVTRAPSTYLDRHVRFVSQPEDGRPDGSGVDAEVLRIVAAERLALFGSHRPYWDGVDPEGGYAEWPRDARARVLSANAREFVPRLDRALEQSSRRRVTPVRG